MPTVAGLTPAERHRTVSNGFTEHVDAVMNWGAPTPVGDWCARDVVAHLIDWFRDFLGAGGVELPAVPSDAADPPAAWRAHRDGIQALLEAPAADADFTHPMAGNHRLADAVDRFYTADVFMHTWDLATAAGRDPGLDPEFAAHLLDGMAEMEQLLRSSGQYGPAVDVAVDADPVTQLAAFIGRDPGWSPPR